jgi:ankyrin repeat protein
MDMTERSTHAGIIAMMVAVRYGHTASVNFLQAEGASVTEKSNGGFSVLHFATFYGNMSLVR